MIMTMWINIGLDNKNVINEDGEEKISARRSTAVQSLLDIHTCDCTLSLMVNPVMTFLLKLMHSKVGE